MQWVKVPAKNTHEIFFSGNLIGFPKEKFQEAEFLKKHIAKKKSDWETATLSEIITFS